MPPHLIRILVCILVDDLPSISRQFMSMDGVFDGFNKSEEGYWIERVMIICSSILNWDFGIVGFNNL